LLMLINLISAAKVAPKTTPAAAPQSNEQVEELQQTIQELKQAIAGLEKERDFYFGKLREVEVTLQGVEDQESEIVQTLFKIL
jgi:RP/EB family microtubule-associated protein